MIRKALSAVGVGLAMVLATTIPASAAPAIERDYAPATGSITNPTACVYVEDNDFNPGTGCFAADGDILYASDGKSDGHSVALHWLNYRDGTLYREGYCIQTHGEDTGGRCNKNFLEGSSLWIRACTYESGTNKEVFCSSYKKTYA